MINKAGVNMKWLIPMALLLAITADGGVIVLRDGTRLEGELRRATGGWEVITSDGARRIIPEDRVASIEHAATHDEQELAAERLAIMTRIAENIDDLNQIISRYELLITQIRGTPSEAPARDELAKWQRRKDAGYVRIGGQWHPPGKAAELALQHDISAEHAARLLLQASYRDALRAADAILSENPLHINANYIRGVSAFHLNALPVARRSFELVIAGKSDHGPSLNNLAVIQWQQRNFVQALSNFQRAMVLMPLDYRIHDNVAEIHEQLTPELRNSPAGRRLITQFQLDEPLLQQKAAERQLFRWGSGWIRPDQLEQIREQQRRNEQRLQETLREVENQQRVISTLDAQLEDNRRLLDRIDRGRWAYDREGKLVRLALPSYWYTIRRDFQDFERRRTRELAHLEHLRQQADHLRSLDITPSFGRLLTIFGGEFLPIAKNAPSPEPHTPLEPEIPPATTAEPVKPYIADPVPDSLPPPAETPSDDTKQDRQNVAPQPVDN